jgi:PKD repeat protein
VPGGSNSGLFSISEEFSTSLQLLGPSSATPFGVVAPAAMDVNYEISISVYDGQGHGLIGYNFNVSLLLPGLELQNGGPSGGSSEQSGAPSANAPGQSGGSAGGGSGQNPVPLSASAGPAESGNQGSPISFDGSVTGGSGADSYSWNFGDDTAAVTGTLTPTHTYAAAGVYTVTLTATDSAGDASTSTTTATVNDLTINTGDPYSGTAGSPISFTASASDPADTSGGFTYTWNFGDGTPTASGASVSHTYLNPGDYTATVTVTEPDGITSSANAAVSVTAAGAPNEPYLYSSDLQYLGAFRVPDYSDSTDQLSYGGTALAYDPANNGLFIVGQNQAIAEISIPSTIVNSSNIGDLTQSTILQPFTNVLGQLSSPLSGASDGQDIGGLLVQNGQLIGTDYAYYSGAYSQTNSIFTVSSLNLSTATVQGLYPVDGRLSAGYLSAVPSEWQGVLGYPDLVGLSDVPIIDTVSSGPAAIGFNPSTLSLTTTAPSTTFLDYPVSNPLGPFGGDVDPLQNGPTQIGGMVFVPGTSTVLFFGATPTNYGGYGPPGQEGPWSLDGQYTQQVWAYNANDLLAVKQGTLQPWQVQPYDVWNFQFPIASNYAGNGTAENVIGGVAFDPSTDRLYVSLLGADNQDGPSLPLIYVFQVNVPSGPPSAAAPQIGTLAATPTNLGSVTLTADGGDAATGALPAGTSVTLTAGNVYAITPGASITQVAFYLSPNGGTTFDPSSDQLLGDGTPSTIANAQNNYTLTMSTAGLTAGTYTLFVQATDSNGQVSNVVETTLTIL